MKEGEFVVIKNIALATSFILLTSLAFSQDTRKKMVERDNGECQWNQSTTKHIGNLHASHINHSRSDVEIDGEITRYDDLKRGNLLCLAHHLEFHSMYAGRAEEIGMNENNNNRAISSLKATLVKFIAENT